MGAAGCKCGKDLVDPIQSTIVFPCRSDEVPQGPTEFVGLSDRCQPPPGANYDRLAATPLVATALASRGRQGGSPPEGDSPAEWTGGDDSFPSARSSDGKELLPGGARYEGEWLGDDKENQSAQFAWAGRQRHGQGTLELPDGWRYCGQFRFNQKSGYGSYTNPAGSIYRGQWADDLQNGNGEEHWADGSAFEGQFLAGEKHGWGRFMWGNGCLYEGEFERSDMNGEGLYTWSDGRVYSGQWRRNFMGPTGTMQWPDGRVYEGEFKEGKKDGHGTHWWPDGRSYCGQWRLGRQHGLGVACTARGAECTGLWNDGTFIKWISVGEGDTEKGGGRGGDLQEVSVGHAAEVAAKRANDT